MFASILIPVVIMGGLGFLFAIGLAYASKKFAVEIDPRIKDVEGALAGINCGVCGYAGCRGYAEAIVSEGVPIDKCAPGGTSSVEKIAAIMGIEISEIVPKVAVVQCQGGREQTNAMFVYQGIADCKAVQMTCPDYKSCSYGCLGFGSCAKSCPFGAIKMSDNGLPIIDEEKCTACGVCVPTCPRMIITLIPKTQKIYLGCVNKDRGPAVKRACKVGCIACRLCVRNNPMGDEGISMGENLPIINYEKLTSWSEANDICPQKCFVMRG